MAFTLTEQLQRLGVEKSLAAEIARQLSAGPVSINRLLAVGMPVGLAVQLVKGITDKGIKVDKLTAMGMNPVVARYLGKQINLPPVNTVLPTVSGAHQVGQIETSSDGTWASTPSATFARQWLADGVEIAGATGTTYTPVTGDIGKTLSIRITATNANGSTTATSLPSPAVIAA